MKNNLVQETTVSIILLILLFLFLNPFNFWMPSSLVMMMVLGLIVVFVIFASLFWRELAQDERENSHRMRAGRIAFLVGTSVLVLGVIIQGVKHAVDIWLVVALGAMVLAKISVLVYSRARN